MTGNGTTEPRFPAASRGQPKWLMDRIGVDYFGHITLVKGPSSMTPAGEVMAAVGQLPQVQYLDVDQAYLTDADLVHLRGLTDLRNLSLSNGQITDAGMGNLEGLTKLSSLSLQFTRITDTGLVHLKPAGEPFQARPCGDGRDRCRHGPSERAGQAFRPRPEKYSGLRRSDGRVTKGLARSTNHGNDALTRDRCQGRLVRICASGYAYDSAVFVALPRQAEGLLPPLAKWGPG